ncbi:MAG: hypothetical protein WBC02_09400 [Candidatus Aminicenantaceae bacterium]
MNRIKLLSAALLSLFPITAFFQDKEPPNVPTFVLSLEDAVKPGMIDEYIQTTKEWIELLKNKKVNTTFNTFLESNGIVNYLEPMFSMSDMDKSALNEALESFHRTELGQKRQSTIRWSKYSVWSPSSQLSYNPVNPDALPNNMPYFVWKHIQLRTGNESTFIDVATKFKEILQKHSVGRGYGVFCNIIGYERPWYTVIFAGKDPGELYKWQQEIEQELGSELKPILDKLYDITEQITEGSGWTIPELSLTNK